MVAKNINKQYDPHYYVLTRIRHACRDNLEIRNDAVTNYYKLRPDNPRPNPIYALGPSPW